MKYSHQSFPAAFDLGPPGKACSCELKPSQTTLPQESKRSLAQCYSYYNHLHRRLSYPFVEPKPQQKWLQYSPSQNSKNGPILNPSHRNSNVSSMRLRYRIPARWIKHSVLACRTTTDAEKATTCNITLDVDISQLQFWVCVDHGCLMTPMTPWSHHQKSCQSWDSKCCQSCAAVAQNFFSNSHAFGQVFCAHSKIVF